MRTLLMKFSKIAGRMFFLSLLARIVVVMTGCSSNDADTSSEANFYPIEVDGTTMEIFADWKVS